MLVIFGEIAIGAYILLLQKYKKFPNGHFFKIVIITFFFQYPLKANI